MNLRTEMRGPARDLMRTIGTTDGVLKMFRNPAGASEDVRAHLIFRADDGRLIRFTLGSSMNLAAFAALVIDVLARTDKSFKPTLKKLLRIAGTRLSDIETDET